MSSTDSTPLDGLAAAYRRLVNLFAARGPSPTATARVGLGSMILLAGVHKLVAPAAWTPYVVPWFAALLPMSPPTWMLLNGWLEILFALPVLANRRVTPFAAFIAGSLLATVGYLVVAILGTPSATVQGLFGLALVRDVGLAALAVAVTVEAAQDAAGANEG
ncbi:DoxX family membrane protein [Haloparvum sp. AD34]